MKRINLYLVPLLLLLACRPATPLRAPSPIPAQETATSSPAVLPFIPDIERMAAVLQAMPLPEGAQFIQRRYFGCSTLPLFGATELYATEEYPETIIAFYEEYAQRSLGQIAQVDTGYYRDRPILWALTAYGRAETEPAMEQSLTIWASVGADISGTFSYPYPEAIEKIFPAAPRGFLVQVLWAEPEAGINYEPTDTVYSTIQTMNTCGETTWEVVAPIYRK